MERSKILKISAVGLACLAVAALIGYIIFQHQQINKFSQDQGEKIPAQNETAGASPAVQADMSQKGSAQVQPLSSNQRLIMKA
jgi:hypothetical protein